MSGIWNNPAALKRICDVLLVMLVIGVVAVGIITFFYSAGSMATGEYSYCVRHLIGTRTSFTCYTPGVGPFMEYWEFPIIAGGIVYAILSARIRSLKKRK